MSAALNRIMRVACPCTLLAVVAVSALSWYIERYDLMAINAFLAGVNSVLTWINWRWFSL